MAYELTLKADPTQYAGASVPLAGGRRHLLVVLREGDYQLLLDQHHYPVLWLCLEDQNNQDKPVEDVRRYNHNHSTGDWEPLASGLHGRQVVVLVPAVFQAENKAVKAVDKASTVLTAMGAQVRQHVLKAGESAADYVEERRLASEAAVQTGEAATEEDWTDEDDLVDRDVSKAYQLYELAEQQFSWHTTPAHEAFAVLREGPRYAWSIRNGTGALDLAKHLTDEYRREHNDVVSRKDVGDCMASVEAACSKASSARLELRSARADNGDYWMDLAGADGAVVQLSTTGWHVREHPEEGIFFRRTNSLRELPGPIETSESVNSRDRLHVLLKRFVNVSDEDWPLLVAWMITHLIPGFVPPVCLLVSEADAGKSTATMSVRFALEGQLTKGAQMSTKADDIAVTMSSERLTVFNNVSKISKDQSDFLCQVVDGTEYTKRKLHTDSDVARLEINPSVLMNGITTGELRADFKTRAVRLELKPLYGARWSDEEVKQALIDSHPEMLGCLLTITCQVLGLLPVVEVPQPQPRMIDYARVLTALDQLWELEGGPLRRFGMSLDEMSLDALDDLLFQTVHSLVVQPNCLIAGGWSTELSVTQLREAVNERKVQQNIDLVQREQRGMFERSEQMSSAIRRSKPDWERLGVTVDSLGQQRRDGKRESWYRFTFKDRGDETPWPRINVDSAVSY